MAGQLDPDAFAALQARVKQQSRKAQAYYTVMHEVRAILGSDDAASAWMNEAQQAFGGKSAAEAVGEGREDEVLAHVHSLKK
ncbi:antitoxin Xre/MbcA/ParS toxin-binding domain-containing protein [Massilia sp. LjRoot122]|uniref:antitoxin Xre/MbcA/ParS toxin-binding domain-containing protein n=1 Tax=Massilia sp. LjRoot122 TaxID=3342257 RepID=UPI003ECEF64E